jgi:hypothetical protein
MIKHGLLTHAEQQALTSLERWSLAQERCRIIKESNDIEKSIESEKASIPKNLSHNARMKKGSEIEKKSSTANTNT